ncbi:MoaF-related domain-containing protein [Streptomyces sp. NPDC102405]|uniref:MoaF-related domain-containing protein n=1 Tax=Streptomyces sp. NPDC102405 TaxID=3366170 RepID=UPI00382B4761
MPEGRFAEHRPRQRDEESSHAGKSCRRTWAAEMGRSEARFTYHSDTRMTFEVVDGAGLAADGHIETGDVQIAEIRPDVFLASWQAADGTTVVHVADLSRQRVDATIALDDRLFTPVGTFTAPPEQAQS